VHRWLPLAVAVLFGCGGDDGNTTGPDLGSIRVTVTTTGVDTPGSYLVTLDGTEVAQVGASGELALPLVSAGPYAVGLKPVPGNCVVEGDNPVQISVVGGSESRVDFAVQCGPLAAVDSTAASSGRLPASATPREARLPAR